MLKLSANLGFLWPGRPLLERIKAAGNAGFRGVELHWPYDVPPEQVADACKRKNLTLVAVNTPKGNRPEDFGLGAALNRPGEFAASFQQALYYARTAKASSIHVMAGVYPDTSETTATLLANLRFAADEAPDRTLLLEPINQRDRPGYFYHEIERAAEIIALAARPNLKLLFDVYHVGVGQGDVLTRLKRFWELIGHVQIAAVPSRAEPDEGEINYRAIFAALELDDYAGWVGCEYKPRSGTDDGLSWLQTLGVAI